MRTTKRFTPAVLARFAKQGRGEGIYDQYIGWHRVTRGDPASSGRSHLLNWCGRLRDLLSDGELGAQLFATMLHDLDDSLEQYKLSVVEEVHPLAAYEERDRLTQFPGTEQLARELGIKHPKISDAQETSLWIPTSDLVLIFKPAGRPRHMLAVAFKPKDWNTSQRDRDLLSLEREFWLRRSVPWLLITPELYDISVMLTLRRIACWALGEPATPELRRLACEIAHENPFDAITQILEKISASAGSMELAQLALWQAIWRGELPIDLRRSWRPHLPLKHISQAAFKDQNPIASRRSAWI